MPSPMESKVTGRVSSREISLQISRRLTYQVYEWHFRRKDDTIPNPIAQARFQRLPWTIRLYPESQVPNLLQQQNQRSNWLLCQLAND